MPRHPTPAEHERDLALMYPPPCQARMSLRVDPAAT